MQSLSGMELDAKILSISQSFDRESKAIHVHAEIENKPDNLIPGMYVRGRVLVDETSTIALSEHAIGRDVQEQFAFRAEREGEGWSFKPVKITTGGE